MEEKTRATLRLALYHGQHEIRDRDVEGNTWLRSNLRRINPSNLDGGQAKNEMRILDLAEVT